MITLVMYLSTITLLFGPMYSSMRTITQKLRVRFLWVQLLHLCYATGACSILSINHSKTGDLVSCLSQNCLPFRIKLPQLWWQTSNTTLLSNTTCETNMVALIKYKSIAIFSEKHKIFHIILCRWAILIVAN